MLTATTEVMADAVTRTMTRIMISSEGHRGTAVSRVVSLARA